MTLSSILLLQLHNYIILESLTFIHHSENEKNIFVVKLNDEEITIGKDNKWNNKDATLRQHLDLDDIVKLKENGWEIASHGVTHRNLLKLSDKEVEYELSESKRVLSNIVGDVMTYAYPYGSYNRFIKFCVEKYYKYAFAVSQGGTSLAIDKLQLRRYSISDIYKMLSLEK